MLKNRIATIIIILLFIITVIFFVPREKPCEVVEVKSPTEFILDNSEIFLVVNSSI